MTFKSTVLLLCYSAREACDYPKVGLRYIFKQKYNSTWNQPEYLWFYYSKLFNRKGDILDHMSEILEIPQIPNVLLWSLCQLHVRPTTLRTPGDCQGLPWQYTRNWEQKDSEVLLCTYGWPVHLPLLMGVGWRHTTAGLVLDSSLATATAKSGTLCAVSL